MSWQWHLEYSPQISEKMIFKGPLFGSEGSLCSRKISKHSSLQEARPNCLEAKVWVKVIWHLICFLVSQLEFDVSFLWSFFSARFREKDEKKIEKPGGYLQTSDAPGSTSALYAQSPPCLWLLWISFLNLGFLKGENLRKKSFKCCLDGPILYFVSIPGWFFG